MIAHTPYIPHHVSVFHDLTIRRAAIAHHSMRHIQDCLRLFYCTICDSIKQSQEHIRSQEQDLEFTFFGSHVPRGQKKNRIDSAVRLRHLPTGIVVVQTGSRSQFKNKEAALEGLLRRLEALRYVLEPRVATRPSRSGKVKRLRSKQLCSDVKKLRMPPEEE